MADNKFLKEKIFGGKTLGDLYQEIHSDIEEFKEQLNATLEQVTPQLTTSNDVMMMLPLINGLFANGIKNTANLTKIAEILTKALSQKEVVENPKIKDDDTDEVFKEMDAILKQAKEKKLLTK